MRAFGKDRARETQAPARSILAAVPTPLGPPVGCHPTPSDGIAYPTPRYVGVPGSTGKGLIVKRFVTLLDHFHLYLAKSLYYYTQYDTQYILRMYICDV